MKPTELQNKLASFLVDQALEAEQPLSLEVDGKDEKYVRCRFQGVEIYLYDDGFDIQASDVDIRFEPDDIVSTEDAIVKLRRELGKLR